MRYRTFPGTDVTASVIGLDTWTLSTSWWEKGVQGRYRMVVGCGRVVRARAGGWNDPDELEPAGAASRHIYNRVSAGDRSKLLLQHPPDTCIGDAGGEAMEQAAAC